MVNVFLHSGGIELQRNIFYEVQQKGHEESAIWEGMEKAFQVMKEAVASGLNDDSTCGNAANSSGICKSFSVWSI